MLKHYLTVAFRNMRKYRNQTLISIIGLAVGFTCFALASLWIRYEMTYDAFHKNAGQIYVLSIPENASSTGYFNYAPYPLAAYLKENFPEVAEACNISSREITVTVNEAEYPVQITYADSSFLSIFNIRIIEGNAGFMIPKSGNIAITEEKSKALFPGESPLGKKVSAQYYGEMTICAVVTGWSKHSNYPFEFLLSTTPDNNWRSFYHLLVKLTPGTDRKSFADKLYHLRIEQDKYILDKTKMTPLTAIHYENPNEVPKIKFQHLVLFAVSGVLVILCSLFNYLTIFVCRFRIREKEFALRRVSGASGRSLFTLLSVEFLASLTLALLSGLLLIQALSAPFQKLANIQLDLSAIYMEILFYMTLIIALSLLIFLITLFLFQGKALNNTIRKSSKNVFHRGSILFQLIISVGFVFCTVVLIKQLYFLQHTNLGLSYKNTALVMTFKDPGATKNLEKQLQQIPEVTETLYGFWPLVPHIGIVGDQNPRITDWENKPEGAEEMNIQRIFISKQFVDFYGLQLVEGEMPDEDEPAENVLINESAAKAFGWKQAVGKKFSDKTVKGVIRNIYSSTPTAPVKPAYYVNTTEKTGNFCLFKYREGMWKSCKNKVEELIHNEEYAPAEFYLLNSEESYNLFLQSENALMKLLSIVSFVCVIVCVFGFFSLVSLTCEERRKEIAIRKINGATIRDILNIFFREYFTLLLVGSAIAFAVGYYIMRQWLEQYVLQTTIPAWVYLSIVLAMALVIVLCVGWRVYRASVENPAEVVKSE